MSTTYTGVISLLLNEKRAVFPITSADGVLLEPTDTTTKLSEKLVEIDKDIEQITKVTNTILKDGDGSIEYTEAGLAHTNTTTIQLGLNPIANEAIYKFKIDKNGHITDIKEASLEDFGVGMPIKYCGEYNSSFTLSVGGMYLVNAEFIKKYNKGDVNDFAIYNGIDFNIILSDINPNIQLNNGTVHIYGTGGVTNIYAPTELGKDGEVLTTTENGLEWKTIHAPTKLGNAGYVLATNSTKNGLEWKPIPTTNVEFNSDGNKLTIGDKTISFTGGTGISVNSEKTYTTTDITVSSLYSYNKRDFTTDNNTISLKNPQEQVKLSAGNGIGIINNTVSVKLDSDSDSYLTVGKKGLKLSGVEAAIDSEKKYRTDADTALDNKISSLETAVKTAAENLNLEINTRKTNDDALDTRVDSLKAMVNPINSGYPYIVEEIWGEDHKYNFENLSRIDKLANNTQVALKEIWGENHNYDWSKSSRIDNLESTVKQSFEDEINYGNNIFNFGLIFENISLATHNNAIVAGTNLGKIYLPTTGKCKICFKVLGTENTKILIGNHIKDVLLGSDYTVVKYTEYIIYDNLSKPYLNIKSKNGKIFIKDLSIQFENYNNITQQKIIKTVNTYTSTRTISKLDSGFSSELGYNTYTDLRTVNITEPGFYKLTYEILASRDSCIAALMYYTPDLEDIPFKVDDYSWVTKPDYGLDSSGTINWYVNMDWYKADCMKAYPFKSNTNKTCLILYYVPYIHSYGCNLYLRVYGDQNYLSTTFKIKDFHLDKVVLNTETINNSTINTSTINNSIINNPNLILSSGTSKLFSGTNDAGNVCLKYTLGGILKWTLDENGIQMNTDSNLPAEPIEGTVFYYSLNRPTINTKLSNLEKRFLNVFNININTKNGYYISPINTQLGLDYEVHDCYVINNGSLSTINIYVRNDHIIHDPNLVA